MRTKPTFWIWSPLEQGWRQPGGIGYTLDISKAGYLDARAAKRLIEEENKALEFHEPYNLIAVASVPIFKV